MSSQQARIHYTITPTNSAAHLFTISCVIDHPDPAGQQVWLPAWIPGSYMIRDFAKNIVTLTTHDAHGPVEIQKLDKQTWRCAPCTAPLTLEYTVYAWDLSVRSAHLDTTHAFFNGSSVFLAVHGQEDQAVAVQINLPAGDAFAHWRVATTLARKDTPLFAPGAYYAQDYDELIDHPVEMGDFSEAEFNVNGTPHHIVISGRHQCDMARLCADVQKICTTHVNIFGELPEMERYMFLLTVVGEGYGGLEHRSSTALICNRKDLPVKTDARQSDDYISLLGLFSHEYFHTWNVKRIKPDEFIPYDLKQEVPTRQLWAFEGITSYYDDLGLVRSGVIDDKKYLELLGKNITRVMRGSGRLKQTLVDSSFDAWTKFYKQDENAANAIVSYYAKGAMFALALDLKIRALTDNKRSLDDVMRRLWQEYGKPGIGVDDHTIEALASGLCGQSLQRFFTQYLGGTEDLPLADLLQTMGVQLRQRVAESFDDMGGVPAKNNSPPAAYNLGVRLSPDPFGVRLQILLENGDLQRAGLSAGDVIVAVNDLKATKDNLAGLLAPFSVGDSIAVHAFRRDELMRFEVTLSAPKADTFYLELDEDTPALQRRQAWLQLPMPANAEPFLKSV